MSYDLRCFGWESCVIPHTLKSIQNLVPTWNHLKIIRQNRSIRDYPDELYFLNQFFYDLSGNPYMPGYTKGTHIGDGSYAHIYLGKRGIFRPLNNKTDGIVRMLRSVPMEDICIKAVPLRVTREEQRGTPHTRHKAYDEEIRAILHEAFLHALVLKVFEKEGLRRHVPFLHEVIGLTKKGHAANTPDDFEAIWLLMEKLKGCTLEMYLKRNMIPFHFKENEEILVDILVQLAHYLNILQINLRFNHRDMKLNNLFVRYTNNMEKITLEIPNYGTHTCTRTITLLDFGFSCIGCEATNSTIISAGTWFHEEDNCFKKGRDLCTFLYSLYTTFLSEDRSLSHYVSPEFHDLISNAMIAHIKNDKQLDILQGIDYYGNPGTETPQFNQGIYIFLSNDNVQVPGCEPTIFLESIRGYVGG